MKVKFCGGAQTVTGSQHLLTIDGKNILLECGLFQGRRNESYEKNHNFEFDPESIDAVLLSHAHIDHSGNIPNLVKHGYDGPIYATAATVDLCQIMLKDSAHLQEMDIRFVNKIRAKSNREAIEPLYTMIDAEKALKHFVSVDYNDGIEIFPGIKATFRDAGHILGSAGIVLEFNNNGKKFSFGFSGDLGREDTVVIRDPDPLTDLDALIIETTYGNRHHPPQEDIQEELTTIIREVAEKGGKIIIPSFSVGRTQQLVYYLHLLFNEGRIPDIPIYVDSPMASRATEVFRDHPENLDRATQRIFIDGHEDPFGFHRLKYVKDIEESKNLNNLQIPHIIISASGMMEGGRVLHHLRNNIENPQTTLLFVGYAAKHTLARRIMDGHEKVKIFGEEFNVKAKVRRIESFSAHGDRRDILNYVKHSSPEQLKNIFLVHGEPSQAESLIDAFRSQGYENVEYPAVGDSFEIN